MSKARPICGAKRKKGRGICQVTVLYPNGRCRMHGGPTPSGPDSASWKHGGHSKWGVLPVGLAAHYQRAIGQDDGALMALTSEIALLDARVSELLESLGEGGDAKLWASARKLYDQFTSAGAAKDQVTARAALEKLDDTLAAGAQASVTWGLLLELLEQRRKIVDTESKRRKDAQESLSIRQAMMLVSFVAQAVREHVKEPGARASVFMALQKVLRSAPPEVAAAAPDIPVGASV